MRFYADLHIHSKHSRATSKSLDLENLAYWGRKKTGPDRFIAKNIRRMFRSNLKVRTHKALLKIAASLRDSQ